MTATVEAHGGGCILQHIMCRCLQAGCMLQSRARCCRQLPVQLLAVAL